MKAVEVGRDGAERQAGKVGRDGAGKAGRNLGSRYRQGFGQWK